MATLNDRNEYKFCTIPNDLVCGSQLLMPNRQEKKLLVGCDIGFLMEGAAERRRLADSRNDNQASFNCSMDRNIVKQRLVDVQDSLYKDATRTVNSVEEGRTKGAFIKLPFKAILSADVPLKNETIQQAYPEYAFTGNELTQPGDITNALDRRPVQSLFEDLNKLTCFEKYSTVEVTWPSTQVTKNKIYKVPGGADPSCVIDDGKHQKMLYEANTVAYVTPHDTKEEVFTDLYWNAIEADRTFYSDEQENLLRFSPFSWTVNVEKWNGDLIQQCVGYAQLSVTWSKFKTEPVPTDPSKWQIAFEDGETQGYYFPFVATRTPTNSWAVDNAALSTAVDAIKQKIGYKDRQTSDVFKEGDVARMDIDVYKWRPVYYLTDRTKT